MKCLVPSLFVVTAAASVASAADGSACEQLSQLKLKECHKQRVIDFDHRAHHLMAERAKEVVAAFYVAGAPAINYIQRRFADRQIVWKTQFFGGLV